MPILIFRAWKTSARSNHWLRIRVHHLRKLNQSNGVQFPGRDGPDKIRGVGRSAVARNTPKICGFLPQDTKIRVRSDQFENLWITLKNCYASKFSKTTIAIRFTLFQVCPSFEFSVLFFFLYLLLNFKRLFLCFTQFGGRFYYLNFDKFRYAAPLINQWKNIAVNGLVVSKSLSCVRQKRKKDKKNP